MQVELVILPRSTIVENPPDQQNQQPPPPPPPPQNQDSSEEQNEEEEKEEEDQEVCWEKNVFLSTFLFFFLFWGFITYFLPSGPTNKSLKGEGRGMLDFFDQTF